MERKLTLKVIRAMNDLTQEKMAERLGITRGYYASIEKGKRPMTPSVFLAIIKEFDLELDELDLDDLLT